MSREAVIAEVCGRILGLGCARPAAVAIDGPDAAGKTTFADALVAPLQTRGVAVVRASVDDFELPRAQRHARGRYSAKGYYRDSFDYAALRALLLDPLASGLSPVLVRTRAFDLASDRPVAAPPVVVPAGGIVLVDGVFLLRPELAGCWLSSSELPAHASAPTLSSSAAPSASSAEVRGNWREVRAPLDCLRALALSAAAGGWPGGDARECCCCRCATSSSCQLSHCSSSICRSRSRSCSRSTPDTCRA